MATIDLSDIEEGDPVSLLLDGQVYSGQALWESGHLFVQTEQGRILVTPSVEIIGWTPQIDFGGAI